MCASCGKLHGHISKTCRCFLGMCSRRWTACLDWWYCTGRLAGTSSHASDAFHVEPSLTCVAFPSGTYRFPSTGGPCSSLFVGKLFACGCSVADRHSRARTPGGRWLWSRARRPSSWRGRCIADSTSRAWGGLSSTRSIHIYRSAPTASGQTRTFGPCCYCSFVLAGCTVANSCRRC